MQQEGVGRSEKQGEEREEEQEELVKLQILEDELTSVGSEPTTSSGRRPERKRRQTQFFEAQSVSKWKNHSVARDRVREALRVVGEEWKRRPSQVGSEGENRKQDGRKD